MGPGCIKPSKPQAEADPRPRFRFRLGPTHRPALGAWKVTRINKPRYLQRRWLRSLSQVSTSSLTSLTTSAQALTQTCALPHWEDGVVMACGRELARTPLPTLALARAWPQCHGVSLRVVRVRVAGRPAWGLSSLHLLLLIPPELTQTGPSRSTDGQPVVSMAPLVGKGHVCLISKTAQERGTETR